MGRTVEGSLRSSPCSCPLPHGRPWGKWEACSGPQGGTLQGFPESCADVGVQPLPHLWLEPAEQDRDLQAAGLNREACCVGCERMCTDLFAIWHCYLGLCWEMQ